MEIRKNRIITRLGIFILIGTCFMSIIQGKNYSSEGEKVKYEEIQQDRDGNLTLVENTDYWYGKAAKDTNGLPIVVTDKGEVCYNIASIAFTAMESKSAYPELDIINLTKDKNELSELQNKAFKWLDDNKVILNNGGMLWKNNFAMNYNNMYIESGWPSAFSQAAIVEAYMSGYIVTGKEAYKQHAISAALAYEIDVEKGGITSNFEGMKFYEEIPLGDGRSPHILNGHLYSTVILNELAELTNDPRIQKLAKDGLETTEKMLLLYDQGYWTRYDLSPRLINIPFKIVNEDNQDVKINEVELEYLGNKYSKKYQGVVLNSEKQSEMDFELNLPGGVPAEYLSHKGYTLRIKYEGNKPSLNVGIFGFREGMNEYYKVKQRSSNIQDNVVEYSVQLQDLQWSTLSKFYMEWHQTLVAKLYEQTQKEAYYVTALRWKNYLEKYELDFEDEGHKNHPIIYDRLYEIYSLYNQEINKEICTALKSFDGLKLSSKEQALALANYIYFRVSPGTDISRTWEEMLLSGKGGACRHISNIYEGILKIIGIECKTYSIYEIKNMGGHNLNEIKIGNETMLIDASYGRIFTVDKDIQSKILSVDEMMKRGGKGIYTWSVKNRNDSRGIIPSYATNSKIQDVFEVEEEIDPVYIVEDVFSTRKYGYDNNVVYNAEWEFDIDSKKSILLGKEEWSGKDSMWSDLVGVKNQDDIIVSLHELGTTRLHSVKQMYKVQGLKKSKVYKLELGIAYSSTNNPEIRGEYNDNKMASFSTRIVGGYATQPQKVVFYFVSDGNEENTIKVENSSKNKYVVLNYIKIEETDLKDIPAIYSGGVNIIESSNFYENYEPNNAFFPLGTRNYVAARENTFPNYFVFELNKSINPVAINILWNSSNEYAKKLKIYGIDGKNEELILAKEGNVSDIGGENTFLINSNKKYKKYKLEVEETAGQDRLLLKHISLFGN